MKGKKAKKGSTLTIVVNESPISAEGGEEIVIGSRCPQTFEPWQPTTRGRFYLIARKDGTLFAAHPADVKAEKN